MLPDKRRLHLQDGPIDLVIEAFGQAAAVAEAYRAAAERFDGLLDALCAELPLLRAPADLVSVPKGSVARRMHRAVAPYADETFITPMAAVAGAVADEILSKMNCAAALDRAFVNNGGDIAVSCAPEQRFVVGMVDRPDTPSLFGRATFGGGDGVGGLATSGWRGRSFSLGIADAVTVLARDAAAADAAATIIANAVDLPGHPAVRRAPASAIQPDSDLGDRPVTRAVGVLARADKDAALAAGLRRAETLLKRGLIVGAALHLQGRTETAGAAAVLHRGGPVFTEGRSPDARYRGLPTSCGQTLVAACSAQKLSLD